MFSEDAEETPVFAAALADFEVVLADFGAALADFGAALAVASFAEPEDIEFDGLASTFGVGAYSCLASVFELGGLASTFEVDDWFGFAVFEAEGTTAAFGRAFAPLSIALPHVEDLAADFAFSVGEVFVLLALVIGTTALAANVAFTFGTPLCEAFAAFVALGRGATAEETFACFEATGIFEVASVTACDETKFGGAVGDSSPVSARVLVVTGTEDFVAAASGGMLVATTR